MPACRSTGASYNKDLSQQRAKAVAAIRERPDPT